MPVPVTSATTARSGETRATSSATGHSSSLVRRLTPEEKQLRRARRNLVTACVCVVILVIVLAILLQL
jgi:cell division septal protein FtsQ